MGLLLGRKSSSTKSSRVAKSLITSTKPIYRSSSLRPLCRCQFAVVGAGDAVGPDFTEYRQ